MPAGSQYIIYAQFVAIKNYGKPLEMHKPQSLPSGLNNQIVVQVLVRLASGWASF